MQIGAEGQASVAPHMHTKQPPLGAAFPVASAGIEPSKCFSGMPAQTLAKLTRNPNAALTPPLAKPPHSATLECALLVWLTLGC